MNITRGTFEDYLRWFGKERTGYTDFRVREATGAWGRFYVLDDGDTGCAYLCLHLEGKGVRITHAFTKEAMRGRGFFRELLVHAQREYRPMIFSVAENHPFILPIEKAARDFAKVSYCTVCRSSPEAFPPWLSYMAGQGNRYRRLLEGQGFVTLSFAEARQSSPQLYGQLMDSAHNEFSNRLDVRPFLTEDTKGTAWDMSFLTARGGKLAAYLLVLSPDGRSVVLEQIATAANLLGSGVILLPIFYATEAFRKARIKRLAYTLYESSVEANILQRTTGCVTPCRTRFYDYVYEG